MRVKQPGSAGEFLSLLGVLLIAGAIFLAQALPVMAAWPADEGSEEAHAVGGPRYKQFFTEYDPSQDEQKPWEKATQPAEVPRRNVSPEQFGVHEEVIENDELIFFFLGQYIEAPYRLTRRGVKIYVNDVMVSERRWPGDFYLADDPPQPAGLSRESSFADLGEDWLRLKDRYIFSNFRNQEARQRFIRAYLDLPFVQRVTITPHPESYLPIFTAVAFNGDKFSGCIIYTADLRPAPPEYMAEILEENVEQWRAMLKQSGFQWGWTGHSPGSQVWDSAPEILEILQSKEEVKAKAKRLAPLVYGRPPFWDYGELEKRLAASLPNFRGNEQLTQRVQTVLRDREVYRARERERKAEELRREQNEKLREQEKKKSIPSFPFRPGEWLGRRKEIDDLKDIHPQRRIHPELTG